MENGQLDSGKIELKELKEKYIDVVLSVIKLVVIVSMPVGFIYLLSFTSANGISLPLSLSELPTLLLSMFGLGSAFAIILLGFVFLPTASKFGLLGNDSILIFDEVGKGNLRKYVLTMGMPLLLFLFAFLASVLKIFDGWYWLVYMLMGIMALALFIFGIYSCYTKERLKVAGIILYFLLICVYWILMGLVLFVKLLANQFPEMSNVGFIIAILSSSLFMLFILFLMIVPGKNKKSIPRTFWYGVGIAVILLPPLINPVAVKLAEASLNFMKIGGGYQTIYVLNEKYRKDLPCQIVNLEYPNRTVPLYVVLDIGKRIFVKLNKENGAIVYALPSDAVIAQIYWKGVLSHSAPSEI